MGQTVRLDGGKPSDDSGQMDASPYPKVYIQYTLHSTEQDPVNLRTISGSLD